MSGLSIDDLVQAVALQEPSMLTRVPGVGKKTAERLTFNMLAYWDEKAFHEFCELLRTIKSKLHRCEKCGSLVEEDRCPYCTEDRMSGGTLCVVAHPKDAYILLVTLFV